MADHNIEINVNLNGADRARTDLSDLKSVLDSLNNKTITPRIATAQIDQAIQQAKREIDTLERQAKAMSLDLGFKGNASAEIAKLEENLKSLQKQYQHVQNTTKDLGELSKIGAAIRETEGRIADLKPLQELQEQTDAAKEKLNELTNTKSDIRIETNLQEAMADIDTTRSKVEQLIGVLETASSVAGSISSGFSALGNIGGVFASAFEGMSGLFKFDAVGTASRYLTAMATRAITGQISGIVERYDIMNTFEDYMTLAGVSSAQANASLNAVDQSIRGIPIGLDEAAFRLRKYQMYMNDIDRATNFTIGIQKAITAGGASEQMKSTAYTQIDRLLATGKLGQSRQWLSLFNGLGVSLRFLREELALDPTADLKTIASDLADGTIATDDFLRAIERLADNKGLDQALEIYKSTVEAWRANIDNAIKRGGQNIMDSVNSVMEDTLGYGITGTMKTIRDGIDTVSKNASAYIENNPQHAQTLSGAIGGLVERAMTLDGGRLVDNIVTNIGGLADAAGRVFDSIPSGFLEDFTSFATTWAGPMATVMKAAQSGLPAVLGVFKGIKDWDMGNLMEKIATETGRMAGYIGKIIGALPEGFMTDLISFGLVWGKPLASVFGAISGALRDMSGALAEGATFSSSNGILGQLTWLVANHPLIMGAIAAIGAVVGIVAHNVKEASDAYDGFIDKVLDESGLKQMQETTDSIVAEADSIRDSYTDAQKTYDDQLASIRVNADEASKLLQNIVETDEKLGNLSAGSKYYDELTASQQANLEKMKELQPELAEILELDTQGRLKNAEAVREQGQSYIDYLAKSAEAEAAKGAYKDTFSTYLDARANEQRNLAQQWELNRKIMAWSEEQERNTREIGRNLNASDVAANDPLYTRNAYLQTQIDNALEQRAQLQESYRENHQLIKDTEFDLDFLQGEMFDLEVAAREIGWQNTIALMKDLGGAASKLAEEISPLAATYLDLRDAAEEALVKQQDLFKELDTESETKLGDIMTNLGANLGRYGDANRAVSNITSALEGLEMPNMTRSAIAEFADDLIKRGELGSLIELGDILGSDGALSWIADNSMELFANSQSNQGSLLSAENVAQLELIKEVKGDMEEWATIDPSTISEVLKSAGDGAQESSEGIYAMASAAAELASGSHDVENHAQGASKSIDKMGESASNKTGAVSGLAGSTGELSGTAQAAASAVQALADAINQLHDKSVTVTVTVNAVTGAAVGLAGMANMVRPAKGGLIDADYLADGGFPGIGKGTDTVPAWLTPGEFVMRRGAVGMFGRRFMDRVNKMDIGGAFDALMTRISNPVGNTYNRDNHATVNNYFYGDNGQNYSQRKAYRYAGSL